MTDNRYKRLLIIVLVIISLLTINILTSCKDDVKFITKSIDVSYVDGFRDTIEVTIPEDGVIEMITSGKNVSLPYLKVWRNGWHYADIDKSFGVIRYKILK